MSTNSQNKDIRTNAYVLRRTNYGEADRILNLITPAGRMSVIAKGVRREKSKLAGNIEMFCLVDVNIHSGKSEFGVLTSAKMMKFYNNLVTDFGSMELAATFLKRVNAVSEHSDSEELFKVLDQALASLNDGMNKSLVESWFLFNIARVSGEDINLYRDNKGTKLDANKRYYWEGIESALAENPNGEIGADEIKIMRLMLTSPLALVSQIKNLDEKLPPISYIAKSISRL